MPKIAAFSKPRMTLWLIKAGMRTEFISSVKYDVGLQQMLRFSFTARVSQAIHAPGGEVLLLAGAD